MESIIRDVKNIDSDERRHYERVLGRTLQEDQRVLIMVLNTGGEPDESVRRKAMAEFYELCRQGTEHRQRQGVSVEEADEALDEALRAGRSRKPD